jgi:Holliday junction resolvasome RuvABC endonuclease subunit
MTNTAIYVRSLEGKPDSWQLFGTTSKDGSDTYRVHYSANLICSFISDFKDTQMVAIEDYGPINRMAGKIAQRAEICGIVKWTLHDELGIPFVTVPPNSLKSFACGNGHASKKDMIERAAHFGCHTKSHDEADAFHLSRLATGIVRGQRIGVAYQLFKPSK